MTQSIFINMKKHFLVICLITLCLSNVRLMAQIKKEDLAAIILSRDSLFWKTYNSCDTAASRTFFTEDVEFYHDKGGLTIGIEPLMANVRNNLCSSPNFRLRREAVKGTIKVYPLENNGKIYGAVLTGEHVFYINQNGKPEYLDGHALFTHVWLNRDGEWKMARILSFDHKPASEAIKK